MSSENDYNPSPLDTLEAAFTLLITGPQPLALEGAAIGHGLPRRPIPLGELRVMLLRRSLSYPARDAAVAELVRRAKSNPEWMVGLAGVLLPGLRRIAGRVARQFPAETADIDAEILASFVEGVHDFDPRGTRIAARLLAIPWNRAKVARRAEVAFAGRRVDANNSASPLRPWGHPDWVLEHAVKAEVISAEDAEVIGATRLGETDLHALAAARAIPYGTLRRRRFRAERRLVRWLANGKSPVPNGSSKGICRCGSSSGGRAPAAKGCAVAHETKEVRTPPPPRLPRRPVQCTRTQRSHP